MRNLYAASIVAAMMIAATPTQARLVCKPGWHPPMAIEGNCFDYQPLTRSGNTLAPKICSPGYSWQYGCLKYGQKSSGQLFGACVQNGWGCFRGPQPIQ